MNKIYIIRHGQDTDNAKGILNGKRDTELTDFGKQQAKAVATKLKDNGIDIIYTSPLKRAYETARIIAEELHIDEVIADEHLIERDFGVLTGKSLADIPKYATKLLQGDKVLYFIEVEGGETIPSCYERAKKFLNEINERHPDKTILIVTHGDIGKMIQAAYHSWSWEEGLKTPYLDNTGILELSPSKDKIE